MINEPILENIGRFFNLLHKYHLFPIHFSPDHSFFTKGHKKCKIIHKFLVWNLTVYVIYILFQISMMKFEATIENIISFLWNYTMICAFTVQLPLLLNFNEFCKNYKEIIDYGKNNLL